MMISTIATYIHTYIRKYVLITMIKINDYTINTQRDIKVIAISEIIPNSIPNPLY